MKSILAFSLLFCSFVSFSQTSEVTTENTREFSAFWYANYLNRLQTFKVITQNAWHTMGEKSNADMEVAIEQLDKEPKFVEAIYNQIAIELNYDYEDIFVYFHNLGLSAKKAREIAIHIREKYCKNLDGSLKKSVKFEKPILQSKQSSPSISGFGGGTDGGGGDGTGRGNTGRPGNKGTPDRDPNSSNLNGIGHVPGSVSGFGNRSVQSAPKLQENSQNEGRVVLYACVNSDGRVISADYKASGSTTTDEDLIAAATRNAMQYKFAASSADKQCGTITYNFKLR